MKIIFVLLIVLNSLFASFSGEIDSAKDKEKETEQADKNITEAKLYDIASSVAIKKKIPKCVFNIIKAREQIK